MPTVSVVEIDSQEIEDKNSIKRFEVEEGSIIFDALDDLGHKLPHGCLAGSCGSCRIFVLEGSQNLSQMSVIEENTVQNIQKDYESHNCFASISKKLRLSCRAKVNGDIKIAVIKKE